MVSKENPFSMVPIEVTVSVGKSRPMVCDLLSVGKDAVLELDKGVDDPVDLLVGDKLIARGVLEEAAGRTQDKLCVRITEVLDLKADLT